MKNEKDEKSFEILPRAGARGNIIFLKGLAAFYVKRRRLK
jgi:hypothetical protein